MDDENGKEDDVSNIKKNNVSKQWTTISKELLGLDWQTIIIIIIIIIITIIIIIM